MVYRNRHAKNAALRKVAKRGAGTAQRTARRTGAAQTPAPSPLRAAASEAQLDEVFFALSHPARRHLLARLGELGDQAVRPLAAPLPDSAAQITKHLAILERAGLITRRIEGREHRLHLDPTGIRPALDWIARHERFWNASLDQLERFLDATQQEK